MRQPSWFEDGEVMVINARTCGLNKDGVEQYEVDPISGRRLSTIDDALARSVQAISEGHITSREDSYVSLATVINAKVAVPSYYNNSATDDVARLVDASGGDFEAKTLGELKEEGKISIRKGHGSPSSDQRVGDVPYIKVSDLRAGQVNINPSNRIPIALAQKFWRGAASGLQAYDLVSPERASKNIGEFCVLMPGQESIVLTKETIIMRAVEEPLDQFYLMWAMSLDSVRKQWSRVIFMQTNREDVGDRYMEIVVPYPRDRTVALGCSEPFRKYFEDLNDAKQKFRRSLDAQEHRFHLFFA